MTDDWLVWIRDDRLRATALVYDREMASEILRLRAKLTQLDEHLTVIWKPCY